MWQTSLASRSIKGKRFFSSGPAEQSPLNRARKAVSNYTQAPGRAAKSASKALSGTSSAVYSRLPQQVIAKYVLFRNVSQGLYAMCVRSLLPLVSISNECLLARH